jgi:hypothetical protein
MQVIVGSGSGRRSYQSGNHFQMRRPWSELAGATASAQILPQVSGAQRVYLRRCLVMELQVRPICCFRGAGLGTARACTTM